MKDERFLALPIQLLSSDKLSFPSTTFTDSLAVQSNHDGFGGAEQRRTSHFAKVLQGGRSR